MFQFGTCYQLLKINIWSCCLHTKARRLLRISPFFVSNLDPQSLLLVYSSNVCQVWFILSWRGGASWREKFRQWSGSSPLISASILIQKRFQIDKMERCSPSMHTNLGEHGAHRQSTDASPPMRSLSVVRGRHVE